MKQNKILAIFLVFIMVLSGMPQGILANPQKPIKEIQKVTVSHALDQTIGKEGNIVPNVQVDWIKPDDNDQVGNVTYNPAYTQQPTHYDFEITNVNDSSNTGKKTDIKVDKLSSTNDIFSIKLENYFASTLRSGALYKAKITAKHKHSIPQADGSYREEDAPLTTSKIPEAYFITDFDTQAKVENGLTFSWEYIPGVDYRLYYEKGVFNEAKDMSKAGITITSDMAKGHVNEDGRIEWTIESAIPGQIYSAYVIPVAIAGGAVSFDEIAYNGTNPKVIQAIPNIKLNIDKLGQNKIRLSWDIKDAAWVQVDNKLYQTVIWEINDKGEEKELGRIYNDNNGGNDVGYFECSMPTEIVSYRVDFILKDQNGDIKKGFSAGPKQCIPEELREVPFQPRIPELFPYKVNDTISEADKQDPKKYSVKFKNNYDDLELDEANIKDLLKNTFNYQLNNDEATLQIAWDAPFKVDTEQIDYELYYDVWISEKADSFDETNKVISNLKISDNQSDKIIYKKDGKTIVGFKTEVPGLKTNKTYYVKMVSKRKYSEHEYTTSLPTIKEIQIEKVGDVYDPPVVGKPPLQIDNVTEKSISIKWAEQWYEIMASQNQLEKYPNSQDPDAKAERILAQWGHSRVYLDPSQSPILRYRDKTTLLKPIDLYGSNVGEKLNTVKNAVGSEFNSSYVTKYIDMGTGTRYKAKVMKQKEVEELANGKEIQEWVKNISQSEVENTWTDITDALSSTTVEGVEGKLATFTTDHTGAALEANTPYVILISAYRKIDGVDTYSVFPSFILATTATDHKADLETPKTPRLYNYESKDVRDTEITVRWIYNANFDYELVYSRLDDPDKATVWKFTEDDKKTFVDGAEAYVTVSGLLPETTYNFWVRAKQKAELVTEGTPKVSDWSTPVTCTTLTLANPLPPSGLGLASYQSIQEAGKDFKPKSEKHLTVEWMRNASDLNNTDKRMTYSYVVEFADNPRFLDATSVTVGDNNQTNNNQNNNNQSTDKKEDDKKEDKDAITYEILSKSMVKFASLRANAPYYIKVKTVLTFVDGDKTITKESEYTDYIRIITEKSNDEYDGGENPNIVEYEKPIEETYKNDVWTYELVDAAKITTQIVNDKAYFYTITMENYKNKYDAVTRRVKMPVKVLQTLSKQGMSLQVVTNIATYEIPGEALKHYLAQYEGTDTVQFDFTRKSYSDIMSYVRSYPEEYQRGEKLDITFRGNNKNTTVNTLDSNMKVKLKTDVTGSYNYTSYSTYLYNYAKGEWEPYTYQVDDSDNKYLTYATMNTGLNALYARPVANSSNNSSYIMNALTSTYNITGLGTVYSQTSPVKASQYVTLMLGIAKNSKSIDLTQGASQADYSAAKASGIYISSARGNVTKEQALAGVVKLYEMKHGNNIKASNMSFSKVSANYKEAVAKAYAVGIIDAMNDPQANVTYGQLCDWIAVAVD